MRMSGRILAGITALMMLFGAAWADENEPVTEAPAEEAEVRFSNGYARVSGKLYKNGSLSELFGTVSGSVIWVTGRSETEDPGSDVITAKIAWNDEIHTVYTKARNISPIEDQAGYEASAGGGISVSGSVKLMNANVTIPEEEKPAETEEAQPEAVEEPQPEAAVEPEPKPEPEVKEEAPQPEVEAEPEPEVKEEPEPEPEPEPEVKEEAPQPEVEAEPEPEVVEEPQPETEPEAEVKEEAPQPEAVEEPKPEVKEEPETEVKEEEPQPEPEKEEASEPEIEEESEPEPEVKEEIAQPEIEEELPSEDEPDSEKEPEEQEAIPENELTEGEPASEEEPVSEELTEENKAEEPVAEEEPITEEKPAAAEETAAEKFAEEKQPVAEEVAEAAEPTAAEESAAVVEEQVPAEESAPAAETIPAEETIPADDTAPAGEPAPEEIAEEAPAAMVMLAQPANASALIGDPVTLSVAAENAAEYQWQYSGDGQTWMDCENGTVAEYSFPMTAEDHGKLFRCVLKDLSGNSVASETAVVTLALGDFTVDEVIYSVMEGELPVTVLVKSYSGSAADLVIPEQPRAGYTVVYVGEGAFEGNLNLASLDLPETVDNIGDRAFKGCKNLRVID